MPIKPENRLRYPKNWRAIREHILKRANYCCEGSPDFPDCRRRNGDYIDPLSTSYARVVLTIGHLDHVPENCADDNLRAWCQRCHLRYDQANHQRNARATRRNRKAAGELF